MCAASRRNTDHSRVWGEPLQGQYRTPAQSSQQDPEILSLFNGKNSTCMIFTRIRPYLYEIMSLAIGQ